MTVWAGEPEFPDDLADLAVDALVPVELVSPAGGRGEGGGRAAPTGPPPLSPPPPPTAGGEGRELSSVVVAGEGEPAGRDVAPAAPARIVHIVEVPAA